MGLRNSMKTIAISSIRFYQKFISPLIPGGKCRHYPTCSEYGLLQFKYNRFIFAFFLTFFRILRCNQLFRGGIDYPIVYMKPEKKCYIFTQKRKIESFDVWYVPTSKKNRYYLITIFKGNECKTPT